MRNVWGIKAIFMAFLLAFSPQKGVGAFIREGTVIEYIIHLAAPLHKIFATSR